MNKDAGKLNVKQEHLNFEIEEIEIKEEIESSEENVNKEDPLEGNFNHEWQVGDEMPDVSMGKELPGLHYENETEDNVGNHSVKQENPVIGEEMKRIMPNTSGINQKLKHKSQSESKSWQHFERLEGNESAKCKKCSAVIKCKGYSTSGLLRHLKSVHKIENENLKRPCAGTLDPVSKKKIGLSNVQQKITSFVFKPETREEIVAKLAAVDGLAIHTIANSEFIRKSFVENNMSLPKTPSQVMDMVHKQYNIAKESVTWEIAKKVSDGEKFSISLDEYTSLRSRRYVNVNVHTVGKFWNLGMVRIFGSLPADKTIELVEKKLNDFKLSMENDIVASVTDGANVMVKFGRISHSEHQQCLAHGLHLAVCDVLYKKRNSRNATINQQVSEDISEEDASMNNDSDEENVEEEEFTTAVEISNHADVRPIELAERLEDMHIASTITKVRKIVKLFRRSPLKNEILQKYVRLEHNKELHLQLDSQTRWNSLIVMLERFVQLRKPISKALIDLGISKGMDISDEEVEYINVIISSLEPVKIGLEKLGSRYATLLTAEGVFAFIVNELREQKTCFSTALKQSVEKRFRERRNKKLVGLYKYLNNPIIAFNSTCPNFSLPSKSTLQTTAKELFARLFRKSETDVVAEGTDVNEPQQSFDTPLELEVFSSNSSSNQRSLEEKLDAVVQKEMGTTEQQDLRLRYDVKNIIKEMNVYEATGNRTENLNLLFNALATIPPTSLESERAFSAVGLFITKLRTSLSDNSIDHLYFLKHYFKS